MQEQLLSSDKQKKLVDDNKEIHITFLGDSTIDNRIWVDGFFKSYIYTKLGIKRDSAYERIRKSHRIIGRPKLSVLENVMDMLPNYNIHDFTNDGFTTKDVLFGATRDKVFGQGVFALFSNEYFKPLKEGEDSLKKSQHIIISVGGNNFREFIKEVADKTREDRRLYIRKNFHFVLSEMRLEYIEIINRIRSINENAQIILMTQYYPSTIQNTYKIYPIMKEIGETVDFGGTSHHPMMVIYELMIMTYSEVLKKIPHQNIVVADITSSLNPFDKKNHVSQIEPSGFGGKKIAAMLKFMMNSKKVISGHAYRFYPEFFTSSNKDQHVEGIQFNQWVPAHPWDLREGYSLEEERVFRKYNADRLNTVTLLKQLKQALQKHDESTSIHQSAKQVLKEAETLSKAISDGDMKKWKMSIVLSINLLETPKSLRVESAILPNFERGAIEKTNHAIEQHLKYAKAVHLLKINADYRTIGKLDIWKKRKGSFVLLLGALIIVLSLAEMHLTNGVTLLGFYLCGALLMLTGVAYLYSGRQKSLSRKTSNLANDASI